MTNVDLDLAIVLVHYRTPELLVEACESLVLDLEASKLRAEIVVVDNGSHPTDRVRWKELPVRCLDPGENLGYAGGVDFGVARTTAPRLVVMNPDVLVHAGCLAALVEELDAGADVAGPQFFWDRGSRFLLPPTEATSFSGELLALLGRRFRGLSGLARRAWRVRARRHWLAPRAMRSFSLSGALLALRREAWDRVGPLDAAFRLYFEEVDWLLRLQRQGGVARFVPRATATHLHAQSSRREPQAEVWYREARALSLRRRFGPRRAARLERIERSGRAALPRKVRQLPAEALPQLDRREMGGVDLPGWVEASPFAEGFPAAGERLEASRETWFFPEEVWRELVFGELWLRTLAGRRERAAAWRATRLAPERGRE